MKRAVRVIKQNKGATLIVAIGIMMIIMMVTASILVAAYSLFQTVNGQGVQTQCHEIALDISDIVEQQLTAPMDRLQPVGGAEGTEQFLTAEDFKNVVFLNTIEKKSPLWYYVRCNMFQSSWPYWDQSNEDLNHLKQQAWKHFSVAEMLDGDNGYLQDYKVDIEMYWLNDDGEGQIDVSQMTPYEDFSNKLVVRVTVSCWQYEDTVTTEYLLSVGTFSGDQPVYAEPGNRVKTKYGTEIYWAENWKLDRYIRR